jgi:hypothetical protein
MIDEEVYYYGKPIQDGTCHIGGELDKSLRLLEKEFESAYKNKNIKKPLAYALYQLWEKYEKSEKERN